MTNKYKWSGLIEALRTYKSNIFEFNYFINRVEKNLLFNHIAT